MLSIGEFSRICFVTKKTLRHYDEIGLLRPQHVADNGYRYYTAAQLSDMRLIERLKAYGFTLVEIAGILAHPDPQSLAARLAERRTQLLTQLQTTQRILTQLDEDVAKLKRSENIMQQNIPVKTKELAPMQVYGVRKTISIRDFQQLFDQLFRDIGQKQLHPTGAPMAFYHSEDFNPESTDVEVAIPVANAVDGVHTLPGGLHAYAAMVGPYDHAPFQATYAAIAKWVDDNGYRITAAPFEIYLRGGEGVDPADNITEIYFPIAK